MSKKRVAPESSPSEAVPRFTGWIFFFSAVIELIPVLTKNLEMTYISMSFLIFFITNAGACMVFSSMMENNPSEKWKIFKDWLISLAIVNIIIVGSISAYIL